MDYKFRPIGVWTDPTTPGGKRKSASTFRSKWTDTLALLGDEVQWLGGDRYVVIQVDVSEDDLRMDGKLRTGRRTGPFPGAVVSFESKHGPLRYATDAYWSWQANARAIALALTALRAVDRYGVSRRGEQYTGWAALPAGRAQGSALFTSSEEAWKWMVGVADAESVLIPGNTRASQLALYHSLRKRLHPDMATGDRERWDRLEDAARVLGVVQ